MKIALVGCGAQGLAYARAARESELQIAVCADARLAAAKKAAAICGARAISDGNKAIDAKDIGAVLIAVPSKHSAAYITRAVKSGKPVLIAGGLRASDQKVLAGGRGAGPIIYLAHAGRVAPEMAAVAGQLAQGSIGKPGFARIVRVGLAPDARRTTGAIESLFASDADWLVSQFGTKARVFAQTTSAKKLDHASITIAFAKGPIVQWAGTCSGLASAPRGSVEVCGTAGMIQYSSDDPVMESDDGRAIRRASPVAPGDAGRHLEQFARILENPKLAPRIDQDLAAMKLVAAAMQSAESGREVGL